MEKTIFKNKVFYYFLATYLIIIIGWNSYNVTKGYLMGILPIVVQLILLYLIFDNNKFTKLGVKIWSIVLIVGYGVSILAKLLKVVLGVEIIIADLLNKFIFLIIGILIYVLNEKYTEIIKIDG